MVEAAKFWQRYGPGCISALAGLVVLWVALHSSGSDWYISETHADILFTAVRSFHEFPFYSFVFGGGGYFLQDPQNNLFSIANPLVVVAGPTIGLRLAIALWGVIGCYSFIAWMRRHTSELAAQLGGLSLCASLAVFWRVEVGNDMFLWHLGLPILLLLVEKLVAERSWKNAVAFGLALGIFILGPTFHSFTYLYVPVLPIFTLGALAVERPSVRALGRIVALFSFAFALALLIASPKIISWTKFSMGRPVPDPSTGTLVDSLRALLDYRYTSWSKFEMGFFRRGRRLLRHWWGIHEAASALPPPATLLVPVGAVAGLLSKQKRPYALFAFLLVAVGLSLANSDAIWFFLRRITHDSFRVAPRFLVVAWFGLAVLATLGADFLLSRARRAAALASGVFVSAVVASALWWTYTAGRVEPRTTTDNILPQVMNPFTIMAEESALASNVKSFDRLVPFQYGEREFLHGNGSIDGFFVVGNGPSPLAPRQRPVAVVRRTGRGASVIAHTTIELDAIAPEERVTVRIAEPQFGLRVRAYPENAKPQLWWDENGLTVENVGAEPIERLVLRPGLPISRSWFVLSLLAAVGSVGALSYPLWWRKLGAFKRLRRLGVST
ncbi:MAG TPA: hypothetical protein VFQ35_12095 [Polyangiaceae bacterium]|nr:hypothetical protein [Polyangiaceae bacterium]